MSAGLACPQTGRGQQAQTPVDDLEDVGITERLDAAIPLDAEFVDEAGEAVKLAGFVRGDRPVILTLVYFNCPMLCNLILNGLVDALRELPLTPGEDFEIVTVSFDPRETSTLARLKKQNYLRELGRPEVAGSWHFLTGTEPNIRRLTDAVGFKYRFVEETQQYAHAAALFLLTPDGRVGRYLYGVVFDPETLRLGLVEASEGKIGSTVDRLLLYCFHYDPDAGRYTLAAVTVMRVGGVAMVAALAIVLGAFWRAEVKRRRAHSSPQDAARDES